MHNKIRGSRAKPLNHAVAFKAFDRIADAWQLSAEERSQLLCAERGIYKEWASGTIKPKFAFRQIIRISKLVNIYYALHGLFGDKTYADRWVKIENAAFHNKPPLKLLLRNAAGFDRVFDLIVDACRW